MLKILIISLFSIILLNANDFKQEQLKISDLKNNTATINKGLLKLGQSGIIIHKFSSNKEMILKKAYVSSTNKNYSRITIVNDELLKQSSIANTNLKVQNGDTFILNFMYDVSLLIVPNFQSYKAIMSSYDNNFINSDLFAGYLKIKQRPVPLKEDFKEFTKINNISTIYIVIDSSLYILDAYTFKVIGIKLLNIKDKKFQTPFYTNIQDIKTSIFNFTSKEKIDNYSKYYINLIKESNDR